MSARTGWKREQEGPHPKHRSPIGRQKGCRLGPNVTLPGTGGGPANQRCLIGASCVHGDDLGHPVTAHAYRLRGVSHSRMDEIGLQSIDEPSDAMHVAPGHLYLAWMA
jgi:hypothetical protein